MIKLQTWDVRDDGYDAGMMKPINNDGDYYDKDDVDPLLRELEQLREEKRLREFLDSGFGEN